MTQRQVAVRSGIGLTPLKRFEATGGITLNNLIALLRAMGLLSRIHDLIPAPDSPSPLELLNRLRVQPARAPRLRMPKLPHD